MPFLRLQTSQATVHVAESSARLPLSLQRTTSVSAMTGEDLDGPKTVEEKVAKVSKVRLLRQFSYGVIAYVVATALVVLLPIFVSSAPGEEAVRVVLVMQNVVLWVFMAGLAWIFRRAPLPLPVPLP